MDRQKRLILRIGLSTLLIASLVGLMIVLFGEPTPKAYNARTLSQIKQYMNALELVRLEKGTYPTTQEFVCVGDYEDDACWEKEGKGVREDAAFNDMMDAFIPLLSSGGMVEDERVPADSREGYVYRSLQNGRGYEIQYLLIGKAQCGFGGELSVNVVASKVNQNTFCTIIR